MKTDTHFTKVIFRKWRAGAGEILALFPEDPADVNGFYCDSYEHIGQHGSADLQGCIRRSSPAKPREYASLARELRGIGYRLDIRKRSGADAYRVRCAKLKAWRNAS